MSEERTEFGARLLKVAEDLTDCVQARKAGGTRQKRMQKR